MNTYELSNHPAFKNVNPHQFASMSTMWINETSVQDAAKDMCFPVEILRMWYAAKDMMFFEEHGYFPSQISK